MTDITDLISRAAAIEAIVSLTAFESEDELKKFVEEKACDDYYLGGLCNAIDEIKDTTAVDAVPVVHARWRELKDGTEECTNCLGLCPHEENYNGDVIFNFGCEYCPWCGAKMDGRDENA